MNGGPSALPVARLQRTISAPPDRVYRAWLEPDVLRRWLAPDSLRVARVEVDERVGGRFRVWQKNEDGEAGGFECELLELVPGERIVFRWRFVGPDRTAVPAHDSRLTISLERAAADATTLTLVHERLEALHQAMPHVADNVQTGWNMALDKLVNVIEEAV